MRTVESWIAAHRANWETRLDLLGEVLDEVFPDDQGDSRR